MDVHNLMRHMQLVHQRHRHHRKRFIDLPQIYIRHLPASAGQGLLRSPHRCGGEPLWLLCKGSVTDNARQGCATQFFRGTLAHHDQGCGTVVDRGTGGRRDGAVFLKGRL